MLSFSRPLPNARRLGTGLLAAGLLGLVLAGCVRLLEPRPSTINYYLLDSTRAADTVATDTSGLTVGLRQPRLAAYLDAARLVTRHGPNTIRFSDFHRWGENLDRALNRVVALNLERQSDIQAAETVPWPSGFRFDYVVQLRVLRFEGVGPEPPGPDADDNAPPPEGHSQMVVRWTILGPDGETTKRQGLTRHREEGWPVTDYADLAAKLDTSLAVLAGDIGTGLRALDRP